MQSGAPLRIEFLNQRVDLRVGVLEGAVVVDHVGRLLDLLIDRQLGGQPPFGVFLRQLVALHQALQLHLAGARHDDDRIEVLVAPGLEDERDVGDRKWRAFRQPGEEIAHGLDDRGMDDRFEIEPGAFVLEDDLRHADPIHRAVTPHRIGAEPSANRRETR